MSVVLRQPFGVVAAITPWNAPITMLTFKMAPAIIAGNTLVVKSSEKAPLTALYLASLMKEAGLPPGVLNVLSGFGMPCGHALAAHPRIRKISFTGSIGAGRAIKQAALSNMKKVTLELGGKSPMIVFEDADLVKAAIMAARSILLNSGQACIASSRVYVHKSVAGQFCSELVKAFEEHGSNPAEDNNPLSVTTKRGPQGDVKQFESIKGFLQDANDHGFRFLTGGQAEAGKGYYIQPTIIFEPAEDSRVMRNEIFGPVQCVCTFETEQEVLQRANGSEYGLYASVFTRDVFRALRVAKNFEAGNVGVNITTFMTHDMPFTGWKQSGYGMELGQKQVDEWMHGKTVYFAMT
jgi:aldehyde dehydrogenase (NAD+)